MSYITTTGGASFGTLLQQILMADEIEIGSSPSYQLCKLIYLFHPVGLKMAESPIRMAQSQQREVKVTGAPERVQEEFIKQWRRDGASKVIFQQGTISRIYGISSNAMLIEGRNAGDRIDFRDLYKLNIAFSIFDPLNTSGSLVLNQNPNAIDFLKTTGTISVQGSEFHRSRVNVMMNEQPIYLGWTNSAFGYVGRSVYQRALFPLKSFVQSMLTDDLVTLKAGVIIAKTAQPGAVTDNIFAAIGAIKRMFIKIATVGNVIQIGSNEEIESINLENLDKVHDGARKHIIENIATAADMPAKLLLQETFAEGFGEGTEDAKHVAQYIDRYREEIEPQYAFMDEIIQYRAWNPEFYKTMQVDFPDSYGGKSYTQAFYEWKNSFQTKWPSLLTEPDSEKSKGEKVRHETIIATVEALAPLFKNMPNNLAKLIDWAADNLSANKMMFPTPFEPDLDEILTTPIELDNDENKEPKPPGMRSDSASVIRAVKQITARAGA